MKEEFKTEMSLKVLFLEDSKKDAEIVLELLEDSGFVLTVDLTENEKEFESFLGNCDYDIILSDFSLPGFNAFGALKLSKMICPEIPFICVSGSIGEEIAIELLKAGAVDYILKDRLERLPFAINRALNDAKEISARLEAEEALKDSAQSYRILANSGQALIWTSGKDKLCNYFNDVWLEFTGRSLEQELGTGWTEGVHPDDLQVCLNTYIEAFERRDKFSMEYRVRRFDGVYRWIQDDGSPRYNIKGDFAGYIGHCLDITERKKAEEKLVESEEKYRALVENSGIGVGVYSSDGDIIFFNQKAIENLGGKPDDYIGKNLKDVFGEQAGTVYISRVLSAVKSETSIEYEDFVELASGQHWFLSNHTRIKNNEGDIIGVQVIAHDITERKMAEEAIKENEEKYRALVENALEGIIIVSLEGIIIFANQAIGRIFELPDTNLVLGKKVFEFMAPESTQKAIDDFINVVQGIDSYVSQYNCFTLLGKAIWIESIGKMINYEGKPADIISLRDITERKMAEKEIQKISKHYQALIEKAPDGIVLINAEGDFKYVSPSAREMFGYTSTEDISGSPARFTHPDDLGMVQSNLARIFEDPAYAPTLQYRFIDRNNNWKWVESTFTNQFADSSVDAIVINFRDITERKMAEQALHDANDKLIRAQRVAQIGSWENFLATNELSWSDEMYHILGFPHNNPQFLANASQVFPSEELERFQTAVNAAIMDDAPYSMDYRIIRPDGSTAYIHDEGEVIRDDNGSAILMFGTTQDITERKLAEESLKASEQKFRYLFENSLMGISEADLSGTLISINMAYAKMYGYDNPEELMKEVANVGQLYAHPEERRDVLKILEEQGFMEPREIELIKRDGTHFFVLVSAKGIKDNEGKLIGYQASHIDITERKQAEETLKDIIDKNPMSIQIVDPEGYTLKTNPANTTLFGAVPPPDFSIFDDIQSKSEELEKLILLAKSGEVVNLPDIYYNPHDAIPTAPDNPKWVRAIIFPLKDSFGKPDRFVLMHEDITERKNAEETLKENNDQLERFNNLMVGREVKMVDLKKEINELYNRLGESQRYIVHE